MKKNYLIRLLTLAIYFLPFSFFYSSCEGVAFNKADATKLENIRKSKIKPIDKTPVFSDSTLSETDTVNTSNSIKIINTTSFGYKANEIALKVVEHAFLPTKDSISAIGIIQFFENLFGKVCIILSILLSVILLIAERFYRHKNELIRNLLLLNLLCVIAFIVDGFIYNIELKFGVWCLLIILTLQLVLEIKRNPVKT